MAGMGVSLTNVLAVQSFLHPQQPFAGDGSDGVFNPQSNVTLTSGIYLFDSVNIPVGVTVTIERAVVILVKRDAVIAGALSATGRGYLQDSGVYQGIPNSTAFSQLLPIGGGGGGGGYNSSTGNGGAGGMVYYFNRNFDYTSSWQDYTAASPGVYQSENGSNGISRSTKDVFSLTGVLNTNQITSTSRLYPFLPNLKILTGSSGGAGTNGSTKGGAAGGGMILEVGGNLSVQSTGSIRADGLNGTGTSSPVIDGGGGGGGGGVVIIRAKRLSNNGTITVNGGLGVTSNGGGKGGNGGNGLLLLKVVS